MSLKVSLCAVVLAALPALASAECSSKQHIGKCGENQMLDSISGKCVDRSTS